MENEAIEAALAGAHVVMVDTGRTEDLEKASQAYKEKGLTSDNEYSVSHYTTSSGLFSVETQSLL